eukprot:13427674-Alexandrium_andersonii.AAC.1
MLSGYSPDALRMLRSSPDLPRALQGVFQGSPKLSELSGAVRNPLERSKAALPSVADWLPIWLQA